MANPPTSIRKKQLCVGFRAQGCAFPMGRGDLKPPGQCAPPKAFPPTWDLTWAQANTHLIELSVDAQHKGQHIQNLNPNSTPALVPKTGKANPKWIKEELLVFREWGKVKLKQNKKCFQGWNSNCERSAEAWVNVSTPEIRFKNNWKFKSQVSFYSFCRPVIAAFPFPIQTRKHMSEEQVLWWANLKANTWHWGRAALWQHFTEETEVCYCSVLMFQSTGSLREHQFKTR